MWRIWARVRHLGRVGTRVRIGVWTGVGSWVRVMLRVGVILMRIRCGVIVHGDYSTSNGTTRVSSTSRLGHTVSSSQSDIIFVLRDDDGAIQNRAVVRQTDLIVTEFNNGHPVEHDHNLEELQLVQITQRNVDSRFLNHRDVSLAQFALHDHCSSG